MSCSSTTPKSPECWQLGRVTSPNSKISPFPVDQQDKVAVTVRKVGVYLGYRDFSSVLKKATTMLHGVGESQRKTSLVFRFPPNRSAGATASLWTSGRWCHPLGLVAEDSSEKGMPPLVALARGGFRGGTHLSHQCVSQFLLGVNGRCTVLAWAIEATQQAGIQLEHFWQWLGSLNPNEVATFFANGDRFSLLQLEPNSVVWLPLGTQYAVFSDLNSTDELTQCDTVMVVPVYDSQLGVSLQSGALSLVAKGLQSQLAAGQFASPAQRTTVEQQLSWFQTLQSAAGGEELGKELGDAPQPLTDDVRGHNLGEGLGAPGVAVEGALVAFSGKGEVHGAEGAVPGAPVAAAQVEDTAVANPRASGGATTTSGPASSPLKRERTEAVLDAASKAASPGAASSAAGSTRSKRSRRWTPA